MQQVFQMCNTLLQRNTETRKRKLTICTYKVTASRCCPFIKRLEKNAITQTRAQPVFSVESKHFTLCGLRKVSVVWSLEKYTLWLVARESRSFCLWPSSVMVMKPCFSLKLVDKEVFCQVTCSIWKGWFLTR